MAMDSVTKTESAIVNITVYIPVIRRDELTYSPGSIPQLQSH